MRDVLIDDPSVRSYFPRRRHRHRQRAHPRLPGHRRQHRLRRPLRHPATSLSIMAEVAERVEVLKGPSAMLNGMPPGGAIGGTINVVPEAGAGRAVDAVHRRATPPTAQFGGHADVARRFGDRQAVRRALQRRVHGRARRPSQGNTDQRALAVARPRLSAASACGSRPTSATSTSISAA